MEIERGREIERKKQSETDRQTDRPSDRQRERIRERETELVRKRGRKGDRKTRDEMILKMHVDSLIQEKNPQRKWKSIHVYAYTSPSLHLSSLSDMLIFFPYDIHDH